MKRLLSVFVFLLLVLVPAQSASGLTISFSRPAKTAVSTPTFCILTKTGQICYPTRIPGTSQFNANSRVSIRVIEKSNTQPSTTVTGKLPESSVPASNDINRANSISMQQEMLGYINTERDKANVPALKLDAKLSEGAYIKSKDMAQNNYFSHTSPTYGSPFDLMKSLGITYRTAGENIAKHTSVKGAHDAFMNSPGHRANILNTSFKNIGLGFYISGNYLYVTQWFTN